MSNKLLIILLTILLPFSGTAQNAVFSVTATGTNPTIDSAIEFTTGIWSEYLHSAVPIKVNLFYVNMTAAGPLGITFPNGRKDFFGGRAGTWYPTSLANAAQGSELNPGEADMDIYINSWHPWYFGTDGNTPGTLYDFVSVLLHEIGHGLGVASLAKATDSTGSFGMLTAADYAPLSTTFPFPDLEGLPSIWDVYLENDTGALLTDTLLFPNNSSLLSSAMRSGQVYFAGPNATASLGSRPRVHAPAVFALGTCITHLNEGSFPVSGGNSLMTPFISKGQTVHDPGPVTEAILMDLGWPAGTFAEDISADRRIFVYPNPAAGRVTIKAEGIETLFISNLMGVEVAEIKALGKNEIIWDAAGVPVGVYLLRGLGEATVIKGVVSLVEE